MQLFHTKVLYKAFFSDYILGLSFFWRMLVKMTTGENFEQILNACVD
jgi:hypothetical protein